MSFPIPSNKLVRWWLPIAALFIFFIQLGSIPIWSGDEGRFGEIAREMVELREFLIPQFFYLNFLEKPVLYPFFAALSGLVLGVGSLSSRLPCAVAALAGIWMTWRFTRGFAGERAGIRAAALLTTFFGYVLLGRFAIIDMMLTFFISASILSFASACIEQRRNRYLAGYAFMGLAFLTKGLIGILMPAMVFGGFIIFTGAWREIPRMKIGWGILILAAIIVPYGIAVSVRQPEFFRVFIIEQHFMRYSSGSFGRHRPLWFFVPIYLAVCLPWSFYLPAAVREGLRTPGKPGQYLKLMLIWIAAVIAFFSLPKSKLPYYILPAAVPTAVLIGVWFSVSGRACGKLAAGLLKAMIFLTWPLLLAAAVYVIYFAKDPHAVELVPFIWPILIVLFSSGLLTLRYIRQSRTDRVFWTLFAAAYAFLLIAIGGMQSLSRHLSVYEFAQAIREDLTEQDVVAMYSSPDRFSDFPFHLKRRVMVVGGDRGTIRQESEDPDNALEVARWFIGLGDFARMFNQRTQRVYCLTEDEKMGELTEAGLRDPVVVKRLTERVLISNMPINHPDV
ncbi:MAG: glycosyltransferase family 39 protein [Candidatus Omnitrophica bacterium]|nr:glycosyltransferase family 39 protein [Candidatus Omnitrophota bacterium]